MLGPAEGSTMHPILPTATRWKSALRIPKEGLLKKCIHCGHDRLVWERKKLTKERMIGCKSGPVMVEGPRWESAKRECCYSNTDESVCTKHKTIGWLTQLSPETSLPRSHGCLFPFRLSKHKIRIWQRSRQRSVASRYSQPLPWEVSIEIPTGKPFARLYKKQSDWPADIVSTPPTPSVKTLPLISTNLFNMQTMSTRKFFT